MGKINHIYDIEDWEVQKVGKSKIKENDIIYKLKIGAGKDNYYYEITEYISKDIYEKLIEGTYSYKIFPYSDIIVLITDENSNMIPLVNGIDLNYDDLDNYQKLYLNELKKENVKVRKK